MRSSQRRRHVRHSTRVERQPRAIRALAASAVAVIVGSLLSVVTAAPAWAAFPTNESIVYLAQDVETQLKQGLQSDGAISFSNIGSKHTAAAYNAIGFNESDGFIYGVRAAVTAAAGPKIVRVGPAGGVTVIKDAEVGSVSGGFGSAANMFYYIGTQSGTTKIFWTDVSKPAGATSSRALTGAYSTMAPDITWANGYFWSLAADGRIHRLTLATGAVDAWNIPALNGHGLAGGAFTYGNGNLGFAKNEGGIVQIRVTNPTAATPTFTLVSVIAGPGSGNNDATSSKGADTDLAIEKTVSAETAVRGEALTYRLAVSNKGPGVSSGFTVSDTIPSTLTIGTLPSGCSASGQVVTCSGGRTLVNATKNFDIPVTVASSAARGSITNTATVLANESDPVATNNTSSVAFRVLVPSMTFDKSLTHDDDGDAQPEVGETVTYQFVVTNTGDLPLTNVRITDPFVTGITPTSATIPVGEAVTFTSAALTITQSHVDAGELSNTATVDADSEGGTLTATDTADLDIPAHPALTAVKTAHLLDTNTNLVGDLDEEIRYTIVVTNTGNVTLTDVGVDDPLLPSLTARVDLAPGEFHEFTANYTITAADLGSGQVVNTATAEGTPPTGPAIRPPETTTTTETTRLSMTLVKSAEWDDANSNGDLDTGEQIVYTFIVTNTGNVSIENVRIADPTLVDRGLAVTSTTGTTVEPGEQLVFRSEPLTVTTADALEGSVENVATAVGRPLGSTTDLTTSPSTVTVPVIAPTSGLTLVKSAHLTDANSNGYADAGETITYRLVVTNTGNVPLENVTANDPMFAPADLTPASYARLLPGQQGVFTASYVVDQDDVDGGEVSNSATATAPDPLGGSDLTSTDTAIVATVPEIRGLTVLKTAALDDTNTNGVADEGEEILYSFLVRNTGNVTVVGITIDDVLFAVPGTFDLAPGADRTVTHRYTVTAADVANGSVDNTATAEGETRGGTPVTTPSSSTTTETVNPGLQIVKTGSIADSNNDGLAGLGEVITYTFTVTNTGNTRLEDVSIVDPQVSDIAPATATLDPGTTLSFSGSYVVIEADIIAGEIRNTARATGTVPGGDPITSDPSTWSSDTEDVDEALEITKTVRIADDNGNTVADVGEHLEYAFVVRNTGNVTITGIQVVDPQVTGLPSAFDLKPGESRTVTADLYRVTQADIDAGTVDNSATATGTAPGGPLTSEPSEVSTPTVPARPALTLVKAVDVAAPHNNDGLASVGETITYTFTVTNTGNVTLDTVDIDDPQLSAITSVDSGPLAPGAVRVFTGSRVVTATDISAPSGDESIVNAAHAEATDPKGDPIRSSEAAVSIPIADPGIALQKTATFADDNSTEMAEPGEVVTFRFVITNTGNTVLDDIVIDDAMFSAPIVVGSLAPGQSVTRDQSYVVTEADIVAQRLVNSATVTGYVPGAPPQPVTSPEAVTSVPLAPDESHLTLEKDAVLEDVNGNNKADAGEKIVYRFTFTNTGTRTLTDILIADPVIDELLPAAVPSLAPGASVTVEALPYTVTADDVTRDDLRNVATAVGDGPLGQLETLPSTALVRAEVPVPPALATTGASLVNPFAFALAALGLGALALASTPRRRARHV